MGSKRSREEEDHAGSSAKQARTCPPDLKAAEYFVVRSKHEDVHCIFNDFERCKPYLGRKDVTVLPCRNLEEAEYFANYPFLGDNNLDGISTCKATEVLNDKTSANVSDIPGTVQLKQSEDHNCRGEEVLNATPSTNLNHDLPLFPIEPADRVTVYANGTTSISRENAKMAFGVYFEDRSLHNYAGCFTGSVSSQRADLKAALEAIKIIIDNGMIAPDGIIDIYVNSNYVERGFQSWMQRWKESGWRNANKGPIKNVDLWKEVDCILAELKQLRACVKVTIASRTPGSFAAGRLAEGALRMKKEFDINRA